MEQKNTNQNDYWKEMKSVHQEVPPIKDEIALQGKMEEKQSKAPMLQPQTSPTTNKFPIKIIGIIIGLLVFIIIVSIALKSFQNTKIKELDFQEGVIQYNTTLGYKYFWIRQVVDHQSEKSVYWKQRLLISNQTANVTKLSPIFLYIPILAYIHTPQISSVFVKQAQKHNGILLGLQLRYFGESLPFGEESHSLQNMKYLTIEQMIEDIAAAITRIKQLNILGISQSNPWIINGILLTGTITAFFQAKYPDLTVGAIVSSPLFLTTLAPKIQERLYSNINSGGKICVSIIKSILSDLETKLYGDRQNEAIDQYGNGELFTPEEILSMVYIKLKVIQRIAYINVCSIRDQSKIKESFSEFLLTDKYRIIEDPFTQSQQQLATQRNWKAFHTIRDSRSQWYLKCSQTGLFQIAGNQHLLFSKNINETYYRDRCRFIFGAEIWPDSNSMREINNKYMNFSKNLLIVQGFYDKNLPYCLIPQNNANSAMVKILKCTQCQQCPDCFFSPTQRVIQQIRQFQSSLIDSWLQEHQKALQNNSQ